MSSGSSLTPATRIESEATYRKQEKTLSIAAGTRFGRYEIRSQIGEGGMGEVYLRKYYAI